MTRMAAIEWGTLGEIVWVSLVAGVGLTLVVCVALIGSVRAAEARTHGRRHAAIAYGGLGVLGYAGVAAAVIFGVLIMASK
jgi:hypothetical protein